MMDILTFFGFKLKSGSIKTKNNAESNHTKTNTEDKLVRKYKRVRRKKHRRHKKSKESEKKDVDTIPNIESRQNCTIDRKSSCQDVNKNDENLNYVTKEKDCTYDNCNMHNNVEINPGEFLLGKSEDTPTLFVDVAKNADELMIQNKVTHNTDLDGVNETQIQTAQDANEDESKLNAEESKSVTNSSPPKMLKKMHNVIDDKIDQQFVNKTPEPVINTEIHTSKSQGKLVCYEVISYTLKSIKGKRIHFQFLKNDDEIMHAKMKLDADEIYLDYGKECHISGPRNNIIENRDQMIVTLSCKRTIIILMMIYLRFFSRMLTTTVVTIGLQLLNFMKKTNNTHHK